MKKQSNKKSDGWLLASLLLIPVFMEQGDPVPPIPTPPSPEPSVPQNDIYDSILIRESAKYGYDYRCLKAILAIESNFGKAEWYVTRTVGSGGKAGLFAVTDIARQHANQTLGKLYTRDDLWTPEISIIVVASLYNFWRNSAKSKTTDPVKLEELAVKSYKFGGGNLTNTAYAAQMTDYYNRWKLHFDSYKSSGN